MLGKFALYAKPELGDIERTIINAIENPAIVADSSLPVVYRQYWEKQWDRISAILSKSRVVSL